MDSKIESTLVHDVAADAARIRLTARKKWTMFGLGVGVRLLGLLLIWLGDGSDSLFRKGVVLLGIVLSIGGIAVLRYMLISGFRKQK